MNALIVNELIDELIINLIHHWPAYSPFVFPIEYRAGKEERVKW